MDLKDVRIRLEFRNKYKAGELLVEINRGLWLNEETQSVDCKPGTSRDVVVAAWGLGQQVCVPKWVADDVEKRELEESDYYAVCAVYAGNQSFSQHYFLLTVLPVGDGFEPVEWSVKRD